MSTSWIKTGVKPLSANQMHYGRKTDTALYKKYQLAVERQLPEIEIPEGHLTLELRVCYSSRASDLDNALKPFLDTLQKRYDFNDNRIYQLFAEKIMVRKGQETIHFRISQYKGYVCSSIPSIN